MAPSASDVVRLAVAAHEAAVEPALWPTFLADYARAVDADITLLQRHRLSEHRSELVVTYGMTQRFTTAYNAEYSRVNVWREHGRHLYVPGRVVLDPEMCPRAALKQSEFYNDFLLPAIGSTHSMAGVLAREGDDALVLTALRRDQMDGWEHRDRPTVAALVPHVARAYQTQARLASLEAGEAVLNTLTGGVLLLNASGRVVFCNRAAEQSVVRDADGLSLANGRVCASHPVADAALQRLIAYATHAGQSVEAPPDVLVPRMSGRPPYCVTAAPLLRTLRPFFGQERPAAFVRVTDPDRCAVIDERTLTQGFGLTRKEARLAVALARGCTLEQAAAQLAVSYETARTHLRHVLSKTQTSRQAELVALITRLRQ